MGGQRRFGGRPTTADLRIGVDSALANRQFGRPLPRASSSYVAAAAEPDSPEFRVVAPEAWRHPLQEKRKSCSRLVGRVTTLQARECRTKAGDRADRHRFAPVAERTMAGICPGDGQRVSPTAEATQANERQAISFRGDIFPAGLSSLAETRRSCTLRSENRCVGRFGRA